MVKIKCIKDRSGSLIPIDKIEYISKDCWVSAGGSRRDINYNTLVLLLDIFEEVEREEAPVKNTCRRDTASYIDTDTCWDDGNFKISYKSMTDKVQKIREEVVRLQKRAEHNLDTSLTENERQFWLGESNVLTLIGKYIDSLQEEPVTVWHDANELPYNPEDIVIEHSEYGTAIIPACKMSRVKGAKWARLDDILKL